MVPWDWQSIPQGLNRRGLHPFLNNGLTIVPTAVLASFIQHFIQVARGQHCATTFPDFLDHYSAFRLNYEMIKTNSTINYYLLPCDNAGSRNQCINYNVNGVTHAWSIHHSVKLYSIWAELMESPSINSDTTHKHKHMHNGTDDSQNTSKSSTTNRKLIVQMLLPRVRTRCSNCRQRKLKRKSAIL